MAISTSTVMQASAPVAGRGHDSTSEDAGGGFSDVLRDVSNPRDNEGPAQQASPAAPEPGTGPQSAGGLQSPEEAADLLKLLAAPANQAQGQADQDGTRALAALLGLAQSVAGVAAASPPVPGPNGPLRSGSAVFAGPQTGPGPLVPPAVAGGAPGIGQAAVASAGVSAVAAAAEGGNLSGLDDAGLFARFASAPEEIRIMAGGARSSDGQQAVATIGQVRVLREETHFAPSLRLSPIQQVGQAIAGALAEQGPAPAGPGPGATGLYSTSSPRPMVKVLEIQLQPMELGSVKVSLRLIGDRVEVVLSAQKPDTAELLRQDRQLLDQMLRAVGQKADAITIQSAGDDRPLFQVNGSLQGQQSAWTAQSGDGGSSPGAGMHDGGEARDGKGGQQPDAPSQDDQDATGHAAHADNRSDRGGAVYL